MTLLECFVFCALCSTVGGYRGWTCFPISVELRSFFIYIVAQITRLFLPSQLYLSLFNVKPALQLQTNEPGVLVHFCSQLCIDLLAHSLISERKSNRKLNLTRVHC